MHLLIAFLKLITRLHSVKCLHSLNTLQHRNQYIRYKDEKSKEMIDLIATWKIRITLRLHMI